MADARQQANEGFPGAWLALGALLLVVSSVWHGLIHPEVGAEAAASMTIIARQGLSWTVAHLFFGLASAVFAAASLGVIGSRSRLTKTMLGISGWTLLAVLGILASVLTTVEATALADAAASGDLTIFNAWFALSRGFEIIGILFPIAFLLLAVDDLRAAQPVTPRWAALIAVIGAALLVAAILGASVLRLVVFGPLFTAGALPMLWFAWMGVRLARHQPETPTELVAK